MKKILPLYEPIVNVYNGYACTNSIYMNNTSGYEWFIQNYFNYITVYEQNFSYIYTDFVNLGEVCFNAATCFQPDSLIKTPIQVYTYPKENVYNIIEFIKTHIDLGYYICLYINLRHLKIYNINENEIHDIFIYGYDDQENVVYSTGYINQGAYTKVQHRYNELEEAYKYTNCSELHNVEISHNYDISKISIMRNDKNFKFEFNFERFINEIDFYLGKKEYILNYHPRICKYWYDINTNYVFGAKNIEILRNYVLQKYNENKSLDWRQFYFILNHKIIMGYRIKYLLTSKYLLEDLIFEEYNQITSISRIIVNLVLKYNIYVDRSLHITNDYIQTIINYLSEIKIKEEKILEHIIKQNNLYIHNNT